jgi:phenylpropionate dioxygenase-like ring-hydroxylating dioxygenase large terminal subunit
MFVHQTQLRHLLQPHHYTDEGWFRQELDRLFRPSWFVVATRHELARPGDYVTLELCGEPVLVRNEGGTLVAFQNVCAHRHCQLRSEPRGNQPRLACQYHGWEYTAEGRTGKVPDAGCFRPWDREHARLRPFRVATVGELVLVSLAPEGESVQEFLGPLYPNWEEAFAGTDFRLAASWAYDFDCNWKVIIENSLESYHVPCVHPKTFKEMPEEAACEHVLEDRYTTFTTRLPDTWENRWLVRIARQLGLPVTNCYTHANIHPSTTFTSLDVHRQAMVVYPLSARRSRYRQWLYTARGRRRGPLAWGRAAFVRHIARYFARKVYWEDGGLYPAIQRGLESSTHPGVIGTREERIYYLQRYVLDRCAGRPADGDAARPAVG